MPSSAHPHRRRALVTLAALLAILLAAGGAAAGPPDPLDAALDALARMLDSPRLMVLDQAVRRAERARAAAEHASPPDPEAVRAARAEHERALRARQEFLRPVWRAVSKVPWGRRRPGKPSGPGRQRSPGGDPHAR